MDRHTMLVHVDAADLPDDDGPADPERRVSIVDHRGHRATMSSRVLRRLGCEAGIVPVIVGGDGPLDVGRRQRLATVRQRRALQLRDRSCRFPGCGSNRHLHAHHVEQWCEDGPTDLANMVLVCAFHHRFVHDHAWTVTPAAAGTFRFAPPDGEPVPTAGQLPGIDPDGPSDTHDGGGELLAWDALRPTHRWGVDDLDLDAAIHILHQELRRAIDTGTTPDHRAA